jgi:hypothetical protein
MAGLADVAVPKRIALTAEERRGAARIEELAQSKEQLKSYAAFEDLKSILDDAPELLDKDPDSAVRAAVIMLVSSDSRSLVLLEKIVQSPLDFSRASLSDSEIATIADVLLEYRETGTNLGFLGMNFQQPWIYPTRLPELERQRAALVFRTMSGLEPHARGPERAKFRRFLDFARVEQPTRWVISTPMQPLRWAMKKSAPYGEEEAAVWARSFQRLFGSKDPPLGVAHRTAEGRIRIVASDPFEGARTVTAGYEREFTAGEFNKLAARAGSDGLTLGASSGKGGFRLSKRLVESLAGGSSMGNSPTYEKWARDGKIRGVVWADFGFDAADAKETLNQYLSFYRGQGFKFRKETVSDFPAWLKKKVASGEVDYLVREAHIQNEMAVVEKGTMMVGTSPDGVHEVLVLLSEKMGPNEGSRIKWDEWDVALKARANADPGNDLLYFDTKCSAFSNACALNTRLQSRNMKTIAADSVAMTMVDDSTSPMRAMLEGLLNQEDFSAIDQRLQKARKRSGEPWSDNYILPGSARYKQAIESGSSLPGGAVEWVD